MYFLVLNMAPVSAAERQRKRREKLMQLGQYDEYKAKHRDHQKSYRQRNEVKFDSMKKEDQKLLADENRIYERLRKRK